MTVSRKLYRSGRSHTLLHCRCDCGNDAVVLYDNAAHGRTKSCGCLNREVAVATMTARHVAHDRVIRFNGVRKTVAQWARHVGITPDALRRRLKAWPTKRALTTASRASAAHFITIDADRRTLTEWATAAGIGRSTLRMRLAAGWSAVRALAEPVRTPRR